MRLLLLTFTAFILHCSTSYSQETRVLITEKKNGKRLVFMAENTTQDTLNVFFMVQSEGYRRSADRPLIKYINPGQKLPLITLIELKDQAQSFKYTLVVNDENNDRSLEYQKGTIDIEKQITGKRVVFIDENCQKCTYLTTTLTRERVQHQVFDVDVEPKLYKQFIKFINKKYPEVQAIRLPVIWNKDYLLFGFDDATKIIEELRD